MKIEKMILAEMGAHISLAQKVADEMRPAVSQACRMAIDTFDRDKKIMLCGNGGSAADAQHIAAELSGRFRRERRSLPAVALTTDSSALTAIGNDYGYEAVFSRQVEGLAQSGDLLIAISTSGNSPNVIRAVEMANSLGCSTLGLTGANGGKLAGLCDFCISIPSIDTARIQEIHILVGHLICEAVEANHADSLL